MAHARTENHEGFANDSFLDIVCNMVGILILLVLVVGMRIKDAPIALVAAAAAAFAPAAEADQPPPALQAIEKQIGQHRSALAGADQDRRTLEERLSAARQAAAAREKENQRLNEQLAQTAQWQAEIQKALLAKQQQLRQLASAVQAVPGAKPAKTVQLEAYPAPFIKQVQGKEAHFRILGGRVVYLPADELMEKAEPDARAKLQQSLGSTEIESQVGPIHGFNVSYTLRCRNGRLDDYCFTFISQSGQLGETTAEALAPSSQFRRILASKDPKITTITFWAYQDSFDAFRQLRKEVYLLGFNVANWPMKLGDHIRFARHGKHSESQ